MTPRAAMAATIRAAVAEIAAALQDPGQSLGAASAASRLRLLSYCTGMLREADAIERGETGSMDREAQAAVAADQLQARIGGAR